MFNDVYPINDFGPLMKGLAIGGLGIFHVFLAQFAIGGGFLMSYLQWLDMRNKSTVARAFLDSYFKFLVLVSFVMGAVTGVAMWFTSIQVSPRTIGLMVSSFHWVWATEWTFFSLEVVSGYAFYRYGKHLKDRARLTLLILYTVAAWFSLFWINGILSWQLTPGEWVNSKSVWVGFFNAGFWPSLLYRTVASMSVAALVGLVVVNFIPKLQRSEREQLVRQVAVLLIPMVLMPFLGAWYIASMPADSRAWATGGSVAMTMFFTIAVGSSALVGIYSLVALWYGRLYINGATSTLLVLLAFGASAGGEFVREGVRKPFTVRETLYSNSIHKNEVAALRVNGLSTRPDEYPLRHADRYANDQLKQGALVFREQCSVCHTLGGVNAVDELTHSWSIEQMRLNIAQLQLTKPFMPPFAGTAEEVEALVQFLSWNHQGNPDSWSMTSTQDDFVAIVARIQGYLDEAGTEPADAETRHRALQELANKRWKGR
jgi:mono/diheme cytochrome c family protein